MKKIYLFLICAMITAAVHAQIKYYAVGPGTLTDYNIDAVDGSYGYTYDAKFNDLKAVASFLNTLTAMPTGYDYLYFELRPDYFENVNTSIVFTSSWKAKIRPSPGNAGVPTNGNAGLGTDPVFVFDGAQNITFDGRPKSIGTTMSDAKWIIDHKEADGGPSVAFINGAQSNSLTFLKLRANNTNASSGEVFFGDASAGVSNHTNAITYCRFSPSSNGPSTNAVYSGGNGANSLNTISYNEFEDFSSTGIKLAAAGTGNSWYMYYNSFYRTAATATPFIGIDIQGGQSHDIKYNSFGGTAPNRGGGSLFITTNAAPAFTAIKLNVGNAPLNTKVAFNNIGNVQPSCLAFPAFYGIRVVGGSAEIYLNKVGSEVIASQGNTYGISVEGTEGSKLTQNTIQNLIGTGPGNYEYSAIRITASGDHIIWLNNIDHTNIVYANFNINPLTACSAIRFDGAGTADIKQNNLSLRNATSAVNKVPMAIFAVSNGSAVNIRFNKVNSFCTGDQAIFTGTNNGFTDLNAGYTYGLYQSGGKVLFNNNYIALGAANIENIRGIELNTSTSGSEYVYNTIYIGGTTSGTDGTQSSNFFRNQNINSGMHKIQNNIFFNARSTQSNLAFNMHIGDLTGWDASNITMNHNLYVSSYKLGVNGQSEYNYDTWVSNFGETYSYYKPSGSSGITDIDFFTSQFPNSGDLDINPFKSASWYVSGKGIALPGYDADYAGLIFSRDTDPTTGSTDIGADAFAPQAGVQPPNADISGSHTLEGTERIKVGGQTVAEITWGQTGTLPSITAKYWTGVQPPTPPTANGTIKIMNGYWDITATGGSNYTYDLKVYVDPAMLGNLDMMQPGVDLFKKPASTGWEDRPGTIKNLSESSLMITGESSFSQFIAADASTVLPVSLLYFNAVKSGNDVRLNWKVANEINHKTYMVERSFDGNSFASFKSVEPTKANEYGLTDENILVKQASKIYYRLKMISNANEVSYSAVSVIDNSNAKLAAVKLTSENPFTDHIDLQFNNEKQNRTAIRLYDQSGRLVATRTSVLPAGSSSVRLDKLQALVSATYTLKVTTETGGMSMQLIKK